MATAKDQFYEKKAEILIKKLQARHFDACYCPTGEDAVQKILEMIPEGASIGWGGVTTAKEIGLLDALRKANYRLLDRESAATAEEKAQIQKECLFADYFLMSANGISMDGQMVNIDGAGNRVAALIYGPKNVLIVAGMNKVAPTLEQAVDRARNVAAPINAIRLNRNTPCASTGSCADCRSDDCICSHIVITRNCRPAGRIRFVLIGEDLGF